MQPLESILYESAKHHKHLCPRQVLGARMALLAGES
jgi:formylmethanofuran dehydrogenase subunit E